MSSLRTSVFDASGQLWLENVTWQDAIWDILNGKAIAIQEYDEEVRTGRPEVTFRKPRWIIKLHAKMVRKMIKSYPPTLQNLYREYEGLCSYCGKETQLPRTWKKNTRTTATREHIWPRCRGWNNEWKNLTLACDRCNGLKWPNSPEEAKMPLLVKPRLPKISNGFITVTEAERYGLLA